MASLQFNAANVAPAEPLNPLPDGWFPVAIDKSEIKPTSNGAGLRLALELKVCEGHPYAGRKVFDGLNIQNDNPVAQQIAQEQLSAICHAVNVIQLQDTNQLHGIPLLVKLITEPKRTDTVTGKTYEPKNVVKGYAKIGTQVMNMDPKPVGNGAGAAPAQPAWVGRAPSAQQAPSGAVPAFGIQQPAQQAAPVQQQPAPANVITPSWQQAPASSPAPAQAAPVQQAAATVPANGPWEGGAQQTAQTAAPAQQPAAQAEQPQVQPSWAKPAETAPVQQAQPAQPVAQEQPAPALTQPQNTEVPAWARAAQG